MEQIERLKKATDLILECEKTKQTSEIIICSGTCTTFVKIIFKDYFTETEEAKIMISDIFKRNHKCKVISDNTITFEIK